MQKDAVGEEAYADFKKSDIGDIYGVKGYVFRNKRQMRFPYMQRKSHFCPSHFRCFRRSSTESPTQIQDTARDTLTS